MRIENVNVYGLNESVIASGLPMTAIGCNSDYDIERAKKLGRAKPSSGHDCYLKGIIVQFDMSLSQAMLSQIERYHFIDIVSSQSKMHRIETVTEDDFNVYVDEHIIDKFIEYKDSILSKVEEGRLSKNTALQCLVYSCPCGLEMTARFTTNYLQLKTILKQRRYHRLDEWQEFCDWIVELPKFAQLCLGGE